MATTMSKKEGQKQDEEAEDKNNIGMVVWAPSKATIEACSGRQMSLVLVPGADVLPSQCAALGQQFGEEFLEFHVPRAAWVGIPHLPLEIVQPPFIPAAVRRITAQV